MHGAETNLETKIPLMENDCVGCAQQMQQKESRTKLTVKNQSKISGFYHSTVSFHATVTAFNFHFVSRIESARHLCLATNVLKIHVLSWFYLLRLQKSQNLTSMRTNNAAKKRRVAHSTRFNIISKSWMSASTSSQMAPKMAIQPALEKERAHWEKREQHTSHIMYQQCESYGIAFFS